MDWIGPLLRYPKTKKVNTIVSVQATLEINGPISITNLSRKLDQTNLNKEIRSTTVTSVIMVPEDNVMYATCGPLCEYEYIEYHL